MWHSEPYACHGCFEDDIQFLFGCGVKQKRVMSSERKKGTVKAIETDLFICNPEKFSSIFRWHFWPRHGHLSLNIEQVRPDVVFQILTPIESRSRVGGSRPDGTHYLG